MRAAVGLALLVLAACETTPYQTTPLDGPFDCASMACSPDEVCVESAPGGTSSCFAVPRGCYIFDCRGVKCAPCIQALCTTAPVAVSERNVFCPAP